MRALAATIFRSFLACNAESPPKSDRTMKKLRTPRKVRKNIAAKRAKRALRSEAKQAHRRGTGFRDLEDQAG